MEKKMDSKDKRVLDSLQKTYINFQEWGKENNIYHKFLKLREGLWGFVYLSSNHNYHIIIDKNLTKEMQKEVYCHEVEHIINDMPNKCYIIGIDMQYSDMEKNTDDSISAVMETMTNFFV